MNKWSLPIYATKCSRHKSPLSNLALRIVFPHVTWQHIIKSSDILRLTTSFVERFDIGNLCRYSLLPVTASIHERSFLFVYLCFILHCNSGTHNRSIWFLWFVCYFVLLSLIFHKRGIGTFPSIWFTEMTIFLKISERLNLWMGIVYCQNFKKIFTKSAEPDLLKKLFLTKMWHEVYL